MPRKPNRFTETNSKYSVEQISNCRFLLTNGYSLRECEKIVKIPKTTIERLVNTSFSLKDVEKRREEMHSWRKLSIKDERIVAGWVIYRCILKKDTTTRTIMKFIDNAFHVTTTPSWLSQFMKRNHLSLQNPSTAKGAEIMSTKFEEAVQCLKQIKALNKDPGQIAVMDKTKFYNDSHRVKHVSIKGGGRPRRQKSSRGQPLCMYSFLVADGTLGPLYLETSTKKHLLTGIKSDYAYIVHTKINEKRRGETGFFRFLKTCLEDNYLNRGDVLLTDNEASFKTPKIRKFLSRRGIILIPFPSYLNHLMNPCDNYFHASVKRRYWSLIDRLNRMNFSQKVDAIREAFFSEKESTIIAYFKNCGIIGGKNSSDVVKSLFSEGLFPAQKFRSLHIVQLDKYIEWKTKGKITCFQDFLNEEHCPFANLSFQKG